MAKKGDLKIRALIPDDETDLGKALEEQGFAVKPYSNLKTLNRLNEALSGIPPEEAVLLFYAITHTSDPSVLPTATASLAEPPPGFNTLFAIPREKRKPLHEIMIAQVLQMSLRQRLATQNRNQVGLVFMLPRESDLMNSIPRSAHALFRNATKAEIDALVNECVADLRITYKETRQQIRDELDLPSFDIDFEEEGVSPAGISTTENGVKNESAAMPVNPVPYSPDAPHAIELASRFETVVHHRNYFSKGESDGIVDAEFGADGSVKMREEPTTARSAIADLAPPAALEGVESEEAWLSYEKPLKTAPAVAQSEPDPKASLAASIFPENESDDKEDTIFEDRESEWIGMDEILTGAMAQGGTSSIPPHSVIAWEASEFAPSADPANEVKVPMVHGAAYKGVVDMRVAERQQALRLEDREQVIQILARYLMPLDLSRFSQPKEGFDPRGRMLFKNHEPNHEIVSSSDWTTSRNLLKSAEVLGILSLIELQEIAQNAARPHAGRKFEPVTLHLGPGDGKIMDEFAEAEIHLKNGNRKPTRHIGMARSLLFGLSDLLDRSMTTDLPDSTAQALRQFNRRITHLLQREFGRFGRMKINLNLPEDQIRLKDYLIRLAKNPESLGYARGDRETFSTTGKYADDKPDLLSDEEVRCFAEFTTDPGAFFEKYHGAFFHPGSQGNMNALLDLGQRDILFGDFKDMPSFLEKAGAFITFAYSVKGFSHLEDFDYGVAFNEVAARLAPGGILIDDGVVESYTWHQRIQVLRDVQKNLGNDYRFYLIGDQERPLSVIVQRGIRNRTGDHCDFSLSEITKNCPKSKVVNLKNYETVWPEAALRNRITLRIKEQLLRGLVRGIADNTLRLECAQTWRQSCLKEIDPLFTGVFDRYVAEWKIRKASRGGHIQRKDRSKLSGERRFNEIFDLFEKERGETLDHFIQSLLLRLYRERRAGSGTKKGSRREGDDD